MYAFHVLAHGHHVRRLQRMSLDISSHRGWLALWCITRIGPWPSFIRLVEPGRITVLASLHDVYHCMPHRRTHYIPRGDVRSRTLSSPSQDVARIGRPTAVPRADEMKDAAGFD